jgi:hypothetical protein
MSSDLGESPRSEAINGLRIEVSFKESDWISNGKSGSVYEYADPSHLGMWDLSERDFTAEWTTIERSRRDSPHRHLLVMRSCGGSSTQSSGSLVEC